MKFLIRVLSIVLLTSFLWATACKRDRSMPVIITAKKMSDTLVVVPNAEVHLYRNDVDIRGYTDQNGQFYHTFDIQMQLNVEIEKDSLKGIGVVNMGDFGEEVKKTIYMF